MKRFSKKNNKKKIISKHKKLIGGWNNQKYYNPNNIPLLNNAVAIEIGQFLINNELERYLLNDSTYYLAHLNNTHTEDEKIRKLKIKMLKFKFKTDNDYKWIGNQFYFMTRNDNPFHSMAYNGIGYATWDDGVDFFDYITNTRPRNRIGFIVPDEYKNPLEINYHELLLVRSMKNKLLQRLMK